MGNYSHHDPCLLGASRYDQPQKTPKPTPSLSNLKACIPPESAFAFANFRVAKAENDAQTT